LPLAFILIGAVFLIAAIRGTVNDSSTGAGDGLISLLKNDINPAQSGSFGPWLLAIIAIGAIGYIPGLKPISWAFMALVIIVIFLDDNKTGTNPGGGFIANLESAFNLPGGSTSVNNSSLNTGNVTFSPLPALTSG